MKENKIGFILVLFLLGSIATIAYLNKRNSEWTLWVEIHPFAERKAEDPFLLRRVRSTRSNRPEIEETIVVREINNNLTINGSLLDGKWKEVTFIRDGGDQQNFNFSTERWSFSGNMPYEWPGLEPFLAKLDTLRINLARTGQVVRVRFVSGGDKMLDLKGSGPFFLPDNN